MLGLADVQTAAYHPALDIFDGCRGLPRTRQSPRWRKVGTGMDKPSLNIVRAADIAAHAQEFSHPWNPRSLMHGTQLARSVGLKRTGVNFIRVPAGKESYVYHSHRFEEEWLYVLAGSAVAFIDGAEYHGECR